MRELNIAYGNNRQAKRWVNKTIRFDDLKERLRVPIRTTESAEEYAKMIRAQRDTAKDHGGFVAGCAEKAADARSIPWRAARWWRLTRPHRRRFSGRL